jgi:hypothetical protein
MINVRRQAALGMRSNFPGDCWPHYAGAGNIIYGNSLYQEIVRIRESAIQTIFVYFNQLFFIQCIKHQ